MIEYEVVPNPLTTPPTFSLRDRPGVTITEEVLYDEIASEVALDPATVQAVFDGARRVTTRRLLEGNTVQIPGIVILNAHIAERLATPTQPLSDAASKGVNARADIVQTNAIKTQGQFTRVESSNLAPKLVTLQALNGASLQSLEAGNLVEIEGERLGITPASADEGVFLVPATGPAFRMAEYLAKGAKTTQFFIIGGLPAATPFTLEMRTRRSPGGPLYSTRWPSPVQTAP